MSKIPRLEDVAQIIFRQGWRYDDFSLLGNEKTGSIALGAQILKVAIDCEELDSNGNPRSTSIARLLERHGLYAPEVMNALEQLLYEEPAYSTDSVLVEHLQIEMVLAEDLLNKTGALLAAKGQTISEPLLHRLLNNTRNGSVSDHVHVLVTKRVMEAVG